MKVCEIFTSIQGETSYAGLPCTFVRMTGCNLRCSYCDTTYAYNEGSELSEEDILSEVRRAGIDIVEITGGEPLLQQGVFSLIKRLSDERYKVLIETNGSMKIKEVDKRSVVILDIKTPGSRMTEKMDLSNIENIKSNDEMKFVITDKFDYDWAKEMIYRYKLAKRCRLLMSAAFGILSPENLARWMIGDRLNARLNPQLHKYFFRPGRGV